MKRKQDECKAWLLELLLIKHPHQVPAASLFAAGKQAGFAESTIRSCKRKLRGAILSFRKDDQWYWRIRKNHLRNIDRIDRLAPKSTSRELFTVRTVN